MVERSQTSRNTHLVLHALEVPDTFPELYSILQIGQRLVETSLRESDHLSGDPNSALVKHAYGILVSMSKSTFGR